MKLQELTQYNNKNMYPKNVNCFQVPSILFTLSMQCTLGVQVSLLRVGLCKSKVQCQNMLSLDVAATSTYIGMEIPWCMVIGTLHV